MKYLIYGSGNSREHITFLRLEAEASGNVYFACYDRNALLESNNNFYRVNGTSEAIILARELSVDLVLVISPIDLLKGVADIFSKAGFKVFGLNYRLSQIEGSKSYAKSLMLDNKVPTPDYRVFHSFQKAKEFIGSHWIDGESEYVIKSDRFLVNASIRVSIPESLQQAIETLYYMMVTSGLDVSSKYIILEKKVYGPEISSHIIFDGVDYITLPVVQDYKKLYEKNQGPNTDGIGSMASTKKVLNDNDAQTLEKEIIHPSLKAIQNEGDYRFFLYTGIIKTDVGIQALEFNTRPGNPEWNTILPLMESSFEELIHYTIEQKLKNYRPVFKKDAVALSVMTTASGYPFSEKEYTEEISGIENIPDDIILTSDHTRLDSGKYYVHGGRVFGLTSIADDFKTARKKIYTCLEKIHFKGMFYRDDVGESGIVF